MKRIAILIDLELSNKSGGHVKFWEKICESLLEDNLEIKIDIFFLGKVKKKRKFNNFINFKIKKPILSSKILKIVGIDADYTDLFPFNFFLFFELKKYDLIHTTDQLFSMSKTAKLASFIWKIPLTTSYHTDTSSYTKYYILKIFSYLPSPLSSFFIKKIKLHHKISENQKIKIQKYFKFCNKVMINFKSLTEDFSKIKKNKKIVNLERGINKEVFKKIKINKSNFYKKFNIPLENKILFFCGRIHELKGANFLAKIHKNLIEKGLPVTTILTGEDIHGDECKKIGGQDLIITNYLNQNEVANLMNICDLFVFPSLYETGPQVIMEAKSCGALCVVSPKGGGRKIIHNFDGIIINKYLVNEWVKVIYSLLKEKKKISKIKNNLQKYNSSPSWREIFFNVFYKNWKEVLNS
jgi:glycosyltransferase involved in cell wall biosynthesis